MLSLAESANCVSLRLESAAVLSADAAGAVFAFGALPRKYKYPNSGKTLAVTVPNGGVKETA
jgi:hypothetical protein